MSYVYFTLSAFPSMYLLYVFEHTLSTKLNNNNIYPYQQQQQKHTVAHHHTCQTCKSVLLNAQPINRTTNMSTYIRPHPAPKKPLQPATTWSTYILYTIIYTCSHNTKTKKYTEETPPWRSHGHSGKNIYCR